MTDEEKPPQVDIMSERLIAAAVMRTIFDLARVTWVNRAAAIDKGITMPPLPHEEAVKAVLFAESSPSGRLT